VNERLSFENAARMVGFMQALILNATELDFENFEDQGEDIEKEESETEIAIRRLEEPLPTRPLRKVKEEDDALPNFEPLPVDDAPLVAKPLVGSDQKD